MTLYHGPRFAAWVKQKEPDGVRYLSGTHQRALREYAAGGSHVTEGSADLICCRLGLHLSEIPEEIALPEVDRFTRSLITRDLQAGYWPSEIARLLQIPPSLVRSFA